MKYLLALPLAIGFVAGFRILIRIGEQTRILFEPDVVGSQFRIGYVAFGVGCNVRIFAGFFNQRLLLARVARDVTNAADVATGGQRRLDAGRIRTLGT